MTIFKWSVIFVLFLGIIFAACDSRLLTSSEGATVNNPPIKAVLQIQLGRGFVPTQATDMIPEVTLWDDGRVVFVGTEGVIREGRLDQATVTRLVDAATVLYDMADRYTAFYATDLGYTNFAVDTQRGRKTVSVYGMSVERVSLNENEHVTMEKLRAIYEAIVTSLPRQALPMQPDEVTIVATPVPAHFFPQVTEEWPKDLVGLLNGEQAQSAIRIVGLGPARPFLVDGKVHVITVKPILPILNLPWNEWPRGGLPRHPAATAYNTPGYPYRFYGISKDEVTSWYRKAMPGDGWRLVKEQDRDLQIWVRSKYHNDPVVMLHFRPDHFLTQFISIENGVPRHPDGVLGACDGPWCQLVKGTTKQPVEAWFREFMGYLGWREESTNTYQKEGWSVRLDFRITDGGVAVTEHRTPIARYGYK